MQVTKIVQNKANSAAAMTVRAQAVAAQNPDDLRFDIFFRRTPADSMRISEATERDLRFVAERRPYNTRGIEMPEVFGPMREFLFLPIQVRKTIDEEEIQMLGVPTDNERMVLELLGTSVPRRVDKMTLADYRRMEVDSFTAWATGQAIAKNYVSKAVALIDLGFDSARYETAATAWDDAGVNAFTEFVAWYRSAIAMTGGGEGVYLSGAVLEAIRADAPDNQLTGLPLGNAELQDIISGQVGSAFRFVTDDRKFDIPDAAATSDTGTVNTRVWPVESVAVIPQGISVGDARFAPVTRASDVVSQIPSAKATSRDVTIVYVPNADGTQFEIQAQLNAYPWPNEQRVAVMDTGITG